MPFCPNCKYEYEKNIEYCSDCGAKLVDELEKELKYEPEAYDKEAFLVNVADEVQASVLISKLSAFGIPVWKKYKESGSLLVVYTGTSIFGIDLYVPSKLLSKAKDLLTEDSQLDTDSLEFDKMMDEYGFEDIDNLEFENDDADEVKDVDAKEIHLVNKNVEEESPSSSSENEERNVKSSTSNAFINSNDLQEAENRHKKRAKFFIITLPWLFAIILYLLKLLVGK